MRLVVAACLALALPCAALAHGGGPVVPDAVEALKHGQIYVDYDAQPTLTELEADALGRRLAQKPGVYVAVLPASARDEAQTADDVAAEVGQRVARAGTYVVSVGGRIDTWSSTAIGSSAPIDSGPLAARLTGLVERAPVVAEAQRTDDWFSWRIAAGAAAVLLAAAVGVVVTRRRAG